MNRIKQTDPPGPLSADRAYAFTLIELLTVIALLVLLVAALSPALARTRQISPAIRCANNLRQLGMANRQWTEDNSATLLTCQNGIYGPSRPVWISGLLDFNPGNRSNWDVNQDIANSPLWPYIQGKAGLFRCPGDRSSVLVSGTRMPRVHEPGVFPGRVAR